MTNGIPAELLAPRPAVITPRKAGYKHRPIIVMDDELTGTLEDGQIVRNIPVYMVSSEPSIWVTRDPAYLLANLDEFFGAYPEWTYELMESQVGNYSSAKLRRFGMRAEYYKALGLRRKSLHICWTPQHMMPGHAVTDLMTFALDIRGWLEDNDLPIPTAPSGIGSSLLRDGRFYGIARARVPTSTNERLRPYLPGIHQEIRAKTHRRFDAIALDQASAYHRIVQELDVPDSQTLYARGHFADADNAPPWLTPDHPHFERTLSEPGIVCVTAISRETRKREFRPPAANYIGEQRIYLWTNEIELLRERGLTIRAIHAAWTSEAADKGLPKFGAWAMDQIESASPYRKKWLKPALHSTYGLLGAKPRIMRTGRRVGKGEPEKWLFRLHRFFVRVSEFDSKPATANVAQLGMIQAEVRQRTMKMANALNENGAQVTHIHADGLHVVGNLPLVDDSWKIEDRTSLVYVDRVSWHSDQGDIMPGRPRSIEPVEQTSTKD